MQAGVSISGSKMRLRSCVSGLLTVAAMVLGGSVLSANEALACTQDRGKPGRPPCCAGKQTVNCDCCSPLRLPVSDAPSRVATLVSHSERLLSLAQASCCICEPAAPAPAHSKHGTRPGVKRPSEAHSQAICPEVSSLSTLHASLGVLTPLTSDLPLYLRTARILI
jgi:hypothetical protein